jgi:hypothetical protein
MLMHLNSYCFSSLLAIAVLSIEHFGIEHFGIEHAMNGKMMFVMLL